MSIKLDRQAKSPKKTKRTSLSLLLIVPFAFQIFVTVGIVGYLSFRSGRQSVNQLANQLRQETSDRIKQNLQAYVTTAQQINQDNANAISLGLLNPKDLKSWEKYLWRQVQTYPNINFISIGNEQGEYRGGEKLSNGILKINAAERSAGLSFYSFDTNAKGDRTTGELIQKVYDPRASIAYKQARQVGKPGWSSIFVSFLEPTLIISANYPVYDANKGQLLGVLNSALRLDHIGKFLHSLKIGESGQTFIIDRNGMLIATSTLEPVFRVVQNERTLFKSTDSSEPLTQTASKFLLNQFTDFNQIEGSQQLEFESKGQHHFLQVLPFQDDKGLDWLIVVVMPESDFMAQINADTRTVTILCILALLIAIGIGILTSRWITRPIFRLNRAAKDMLTGKWDKIATLNHSDEIGELTESFNSMANYLQVSFDALEKTSQELERRVEERTFELQQAEAKYRSIFENAMEGIFQTSPDGYYISVNPALARIYGFESPDSLIANLTDIATQLYVDRDRHDEFERLIQVNGKVSELESQVYRQDRSIVWISENARVVRDEAGELLYYEGIVTDVTARKQAEEALALAKDVAEQASHAKTQFLSNMSHELRTPLNAIIGFAQLMKRDVNLSQEHKEHVVIINRSSEHLLDLINDILDMAKIEAGRITLNETSFDLYSLLDTIEAMFAFKAESKNIQFSFDFDPALPQYIRTDESKLRQVLINLISNAIKFTQAGGVTLRVRKSKSSSNSLPIETTPAKTMIHFEIEDTGPGITEAEIDTLFEAFVQTEAGRKSQQGTGLGLPISKKFIQLMRGDIRVNSIAGQGAIFSFDIQVDLATTVDAKEVKTQRVIGLKADQQTYRILAVDDKWEGRRLLFKLLTSIGFEVKEAANGKEAIEMWESWSPHLILMDMRMPVMDGYEATQKIKSYLKGQATVIIALTASALEEERTVVMSAGCDDFVRKPFREEVLLDKLAEFLGVEYIYADLDLESMPRSKSSQEVNLPEMIAIMPQAWIAQVHLAACSGDDDLLSQLIAEIPQSNISLATKMMDLVNNFDFEQITKLTQPPI